MCLSTFLKFYKTIIFFNQKNLFMYFFIFEINCVAIIPLVILKVKLITIQDFRSSCEELCCNVAVFTGEQFFSCESHKNCPESVLPQSTSKIYPSEHTD